MAVLPVYTAGGPEVVKNYFSKKGFSLTPLRTSGSVDEQYWVYVTPLTYVVGRDGRILQVFTGFPRDADAENPPAECDLRKIVEPLLK